MYWSCRRRATRGRSSPGAAADRASRCRCGARGARRRRRRQRAAARRDPAGAGRPATAATVGKTSVRATGAAHGLARAARPRQLDHQRNVDRLAVEENAVLVLAVVVEPLAVVRQEDDEGAVVDVLVLEVLQERADDLVGPRDLAVVGQLVAAERRAPAARTASGARRGEGTRRTGPSARGPIQSVQQRLRLAPVALDARQRLARLRRLDVVLVEVEAPRDSGRVREHDRGHRAAGRVALRLQDPASVGGPGASA